MSINIPYLKYIQGGGSMEAFREVSLRYTTHMCVVITDTNDAQTNQAVDRLVNEYNVPREYIAVKAAEIDDFEPINGAGVLITNKHSSSVYATIRKISSIKSNNFAVWDEPDYDAPGHLYSSEKVSKHNTLNKLRQLINEVHYVTATVAGLVISDIVFDTPKIIPKDQKYLDFNDFIHVNVGDEDVQEMLVNGVVSPTLKNFIQATAHEGLFVRTCRKIHDMSQVQKTIQDLVPDVEVEVLNGTNKHLDFKNFKGVLISHQMAERGVTFPHLKHMIIDVSPTTTQPAIVQAWRVLGYNKISSQGNKVAGSNDTLRRCRVAFKFEDELRSLLKEYYNDPITRQEQVMTLEMDLKMNILPKNKSNAYSTKQLAPYKQIQTVEYSKEVEDVFIKAGVLHFKVVEGNGEWYKGGDRSTEKAISDIINNAPQSSSGLNRSTYQRVSPEYALERLSTKEKIKSINPQWGHVFDPVTGKPVYLTLWEKEDIAKYAFTR